MKLLEIASSLSLYTDNPGGDWLKNARADCHEAGTTIYGSPKRLGPVTATFRRNALLPVAVISHFRGARGEHASTREDSLAWLKSKMGETQKLPVENGKQYAPFITVDCDGEAWISEGNHRIKAAKELKWKYIPVEVRYFTGGEGISGDLSPEMVKKYDSAARVEGYDAEKFTAFPAKPEEKTDEQQS